MKTARAFLEFLVLVVLPVMLLLMWITMIVVLGTGG